MTRRGELSEGRVGPAMKKLTPMMRAFVHAMVEIGGTDATLAYRAAGYTGSPETMRVGAYKLAHDLRVIAALKEEADRRLRSNTLLGASVMVEIARDPLHKDRFKAAERLVDQGGLMIIKEVKHTHDHAIAEGTIQERLERVMKRLGITLPEAQRLLIGSGPAPADKDDEVIDAEFAEVEPAGDGTDGLEDIL